MDMTELDEIICSSDEDRCEKFFENMSESERRNFAPRAMALLTEANELAWDLRFQTDLRLRLTSSPRAKLESPSGGRMTPFYRETAVVAVNSTCNFAELKKFGASGIPAPDRGARIMMTRKPTWLAAWCKFVLQTSAESHWLTVYILERTGVTVEHSTRYWFGMYNELLVRPKATRKLFNADPAIQESILNMLADARVFTALSQPEWVEHHGRQTRHAFTLPEKGTARYSTLFWHDLLIELVQDNKLDKQKLAHSIFNILFTLGEQPERRAKYQEISTAAFAIDLTRELTEGILVDYANNFINLIGAEHNDVAIFALESLFKIPLKPEKYSDISRLLARSFGNKYKPRIDASFALMRKLIDSSQDSAIVFAPAMLAALISSNKNTQSKTISLFAQTKILQHSNIKEEFASRTQSLTGVEKSKAVKLLDSLQAVPAQDAASDTIPERFQELLQQIKILPPALLSIARVDEAVTAFESNQTIDAPVFLNSNNFPQLAGRSPLVIRPDLDGLIYTLMKVVAGQASAIDIEIALDGISRMPTIDPALKPKTAALWEKTKPLPGTSQPDNEVLYSFGWAFYTLMAAWIHRKDIDHKSYYYETCSLLSHRFHAVQRRVIENRPAELLAFPTHDGGWIDPAVLVERIKHSTQTNTPIDQIELVQALLRIANENRGSALDAAQELKDEIGAVVRYALGGSPGEIKTPSLWITAYRAREPWGNSEMLRSLIPDCGPDGASAAKYQFVDTYLKTYMDDRYKEIRLDLPNFIRVQSDDPDFPDAPAISTMDTRSIVDIQLRQKKRSKYFLSPTVLLHDTVRVEFTTNETTIWLHNRESLFSLYAKRLMRNLDSVANYWNGHLELLFDSNISMSGNGRYVICLAMSSQSEELSRFAADALISAVDDCRISNAAFTEAVSELISTKLLTLRRLIRCFREVTKVSAMHALFIWRVLSLLLVNPVLEKKDHLIFLELLAEIQIDYAFKPDEALRDFLITIMGSNKRGAAASTILEYSVLDNTNLRLAALESLESRVRRVEKWSLLQTKSTN